MMNIKQLNPSSLAHHIHVRDILYILKNREEFEGGLHEKMKGKGEKVEQNDKNTR